MANTISKRLNIVLLVYDNMSIKAIKTIWEFLMNIYSTVYLKVNDLVFHLLKSIIII